eukprot:1632012-Amphidinium_carterae.1
MAISSQGHGQSERAVYDEATLLLDAHYLGLSPAPVARLSTTGHVAPVSGAQAHRIHQALEIKMEGTYAAVARMHVDEDIRYQVYNCDGYAYNAISKK